MRTRKLIWMPKALHSRDDINYIFQTTGSLAWWVECSPMVRETRVQSQVESYQRFKKWYLIPPCLTLSNIRYVSRVKWSNPGKGVATSPTPRCSSYRKGSLRVTLDNGRQLYFYIFQDKKEIRGRTSINDCIDASIRGLEDYIEKNK